MRKILLFLLLSSLFAAVHFVASKLSLYWYYWWFDSVMHFWGGTLIGLGIHALATLPHVPVRTTLLFLLVTLAVVTVSWEVFEWVFGLYNPVNHTLDTIKDITLGFGGGLLAHLVLQKRIQ